MESPSKRHKVAPEGREPQVPTIEKVTYLNPKRFGSEAEFMNHPVIQKLRDRSLDWHANWHIKPDENEEIFGFHPQGKKTDQDSGREAIRSVGWESSRTTEAKFLDSVGQEWQLRILHPKKHKKGKYNITPKQYMFRKIDDDGTF
jgi:hypothetical protein